MMIMICKTKSSVAEIRKCTFRKMIVTDMCKVRLNYEKKQFYL